MGAPLSYLCRDESSTTTQQYVGQWHRGDAYVYAEPIPTAKEREREREIVSWRWGRWKRRKKERRNKRRRTGAAVCRVCICTERKRRARLRERTRGLRRESRRTAHRFQSPPALGQVQLSPNPRTVRTRSPEADFFILQWSRSRADTTRDPLAITLFTYASTHSTRGSTRTYYRQGAEVHVESRDRSRIVQEIDLSDVACMYNIYAPVSPLSSSVGVTTLAPASSSTERSREPTTCLSVHRRRRGTRDRHRFEQSIC